MAILTSFRVLVVMVVAFALMMPHANGAKFLSTLNHPLSQASLNRFVGRITTGLVERGHSVTLVVADTYNLKGFNKDTAATSVLTFKTTSSSSGLDDFSKAMAKTEKKEASALGMMMMFLELRDFSVRTCADLFNDQNVLNDLRKQKFDLLILPMFVPCDALLAAYLKVPFVVMTASFRYPAFDEDVFHVAIPSSYVPFLEYLGVLTDEMSFGQRVQNFLERHVIMKLLQYLNDSPYRSIQLQHDIDTTSSIRDITGRAELWLCHIDFALEFPHPTAPNMVMFAGLNSQHAKPLSKDLEEFVQGSGDHGVIVFSLGSTDVNLLSEQVNEYFAQAFSELPQRVLWRHVGPPPRHLGNNTRLMSWLPQTDLLAHPKTKLLIYHGGLAGVYEAMQLKKPMVLIPIFADQPAIAVRIAKKKMGVVLSRASISVDIIKSAIQQVLTDPSYKTNVEKFGSISMDTLSSPLDTVMFWIEHVVKFGGSHLRSKAGELNFITLNSLDVFAFILAVILFVLYIDYLIIRSCYRRCVSGIKTKKSKSD